MSMYCNEEMLKIVEGIDPTRKLFPIPSSVNLSRLPKSSGILPVKEAKLIKDLISFRNG